jgi:excisionase family DNA binding protein
MEGRRSNCAGAGTAGADAVTQWTSPAVTEIRSLRPRDIAVRWQCSERHVRTLLREGLLPYFRIGGKLLRIPIEAVEEHEEWRRNLYSDASSIADGITQSGEKAASSAAKLSAPNVVSLPSRLSNISHPHSRRPTDQK